MENKMNPEIKAKWVADLRSGKYIQGKRVLKSTINGQIHYCCLGVLCEQHATANNLKWTLSDNKSNTMSYFYKDVLLPLEVQEWANIIRSPKVGEEGNQLALSTLNDELGQSFEEIADLIEKYL